MHTGGINERRTINIAERVAHGTKVRLSPFSAFHPVEQIGTACLEASKGYTILSFSVLAICLYFITYFIFCKILSEIDLAVAYASWSAVGAVGASLMGVYLFHQPMSPIGWVSIFVMSLGVFLLNCFGTPKEEETS